MEKLMRIDLNQAPFLVVETMSRYRDGMHVINTTDSPAQALEKVLRGAFGGSRLAGYIPLSLSPQLLSLRTLPR